MPDANFDARALKASSPPHVVPFSPTRQVLHLAVERSGERGAGESAADDDNRLGFR
jgi:hypothetical protein